MAYNTANPPRLIADSVGAGGANGFSLWAYLTTDADATIDTVGYFSNGYDLGMRANDWILVTHTDTQAGRIVVVTAASVSNATMDVTDGLAIPATNTD